MKKNTHSQSYGQTLVEFALIFPIFILLTVMIFDFGRAVYYYNAIHNAAREGARFGVVDPDPGNYGNIRNEAINYAVGLGLEPSDVDVEPGDPELVAGEENPTIKVTVNYCFIPVTPLVEKFINQEDCSCGCGHLLLSNSVVMRTEVEP